MERKFTLEEKIAALKLIVHARIMYQVGKEYTVYNRIAEDLEHIMPEVVEEGNVYD